MTEKIRTIIIEDEAPARRLLLNYLQDYPPIEVISECEDGFEGAKKVLELKPDLIFLDIQMPRINGFEMLELLERDSLPLIIFTTAFDEHALKAFEYSACDYVLKPIAKDRLNKAIQKAADQFKSRIPENDRITKIIERPLSQNHFLSRIVIRSGSQIQVVQCDDLVCIEANDDYVILHTAKDQWMKKQTLKFYETRLDPNEFLRVHRSSIVRLSAIDRIEPYSKDAYIAVLKNNIKLPVSKTGYTKLKETLNF